MPFKGVQLDELLNGFLDGELSEAESVQVKRLLEENPAVRAQFAELETLRADLKALQRMRQAAAPGLSPNFVDRVMAAAQSQASATRGSDRQPAEPGIPVERTLVEHKQVELPGRYHAPAHPTRKQHNPTRRLALVALAIAACLAVMINAPGWLGLNDPGGSDANVAQSGAATAAGDSEDSLEIAANKTPTNMPAVEDLPSAEALEPAESVADASVGSGEAVRLTGQWMEEWRRQLTIIFVVDMSLTAEAVNNDYVANVFAAHTIPLARPVVADDELMAFVQESRMSEVAEQPEHQDALMYLVHADSQSVDHLVQTFLDDFANVPQVRTDIAYDAPANQLVRRIVESSGGRFAVHEAFATPVSDEQGPRPSPFSGIAPQGKLVASSSRGPRVQPGGANLGEVGGAGKSTVLLLVRTPK